MTIDDTEVAALLDRVARVGAEGGDERTQAIVRRITGDLFATIEAFDVSPEEFWRALHFLQGASPEFGLIAPGLGFDRFLDLRMDAADAARGLPGGTPRTIEGPLYVPGAPLSQGSAVLDDGAEEGEALTMHGRVLDDAGAPLAGAMVEVWHANTKGGYSHFDPSQAPYAYRRRIETGADGRYTLRTLVPSGYAVPPGGYTERLLDALGRHGRRPAHIHFFVSAPGHRHLTTQINIDGDPYLHDDFAHATRDGLIPPLTRHASGAEIQFDFTLPRSTVPGGDAVHARVRAPAHA